MAAGEAMRRWGVAGLGLARVANGRPGPALTLGVADASTGRPVAARTRFHACSLSKFVAAVAALRLVDAGLLRLDAPLRVVASGHPDAGAGLAAIPGGTTLRDLLTHRSGCEDPEDAFGELAAGVVPPSLAEILNGGTGSPAVPVRFAAAPGERFIYSDAGYCLLQLALEEAAGAAFAEVVQREVFAPAAMVDSGYGLDPGPGAARGHDAHGTPFAHGRPAYPYPAAAGLWSTPADLARLIAAVLPRPGTGESRLLSASMVGALFQPSGDPAWAAPGGFLEGTDSGVEFSALGWGVGFQSALVMNPGRGAGVVIMTNTDLGVHQSAGLIGELLRGTGF